MDARLQKIVEEAHIKFGLENYQLGTSEIYKERDIRGKAFYNFTMEWYPLESVESLEEDLNPDGTAIIEYHIQKEQFTDVTFVQGKSFSTVTQFPNKTVEEVSAWLEEVWGNNFQHAFKFVEEDANSFQFVSSAVEGVGMSPSITIEVKFDDEGKLISYYTPGLNEVGEGIRKSSFTLTLEEIESLVKKQLQLVHYPSEIENRFKPIYAMEEVFVTVEDARVIPFMDDERTQVQIDEVIEWIGTSTEEIKREVIPVLRIASADEAFGNVDVETALKLTAEQIEQSKIVVRNVFSSEYAEENGLWQLEHLRFERENFIEAHCRKNDEAAPFERKAVVFIDPENMSVINVVDNEALFEIIDTFDPAEPVVVTHEEAFEKLISYIGLDPTYVYDIETGQYVLCGLLDAAEGVDAVTGEIVSLAEF